MFFPCPSHNEFGLFPALKQMPFPVSDMLMLPGHAATEPSQVRWSSPFLLWFLSYFPSLLAGLLLNVHHTPWLEQFQWLSPKLVATQNCRKTYWGSSSPRYSLIHCRGSWWQHPVLRSLKPFYYRKSLWPFILRISHISGVCRRCLIFSRGNPLGPLFVPWNSI